MRNEILVTGYIDPDLDSLACSFAYAYFLNQTGHKAVASVFGKYHDEADHVISENKLRLDIKEFNPVEFEKIILVDTCDLDAIDKRIDLEKVVEIIDHHRINSAEKFPNAKIQIEMVGAAATLIAEKFLNQKVKLTRDLATLLYGAIISNTLNLKARVTTKRDKKMAEFLKGDFNILNDFAHTMFMAKSDFSGDKLTKEIRADFNNYKGYYFGDTNVGISQIEMVGGEELVKNRKDEIIRSLRAIKKNLSLDIVFLSVVDLEADQNIFIAPDEGVEKFISKVLNIKFTNHKAMRRGFIMRKEITPLIKEKLQK